MNKLVKKSKKVKRKRIQWLDLLVKVKNDEMHQYFNELFSRHKDRKRSNHLSLNRCAYNTLRHFYSTTTIDELVRKLGL